MEVHESGSLAARLLEKLAGMPKIASTEQLAQAVGESVAAVGETLARLAAEGSVASPAAGALGRRRPLDAARASQIEHAVREYAEAHPARYGIMKGELKSALKATLDGGVFDAAFASLVADATIEQKGERVRPAGVPWEPPAEVMRCSRAWRPSSRPRDSWCPRWRTGRSASAPPPPRSPRSATSLGRLVRVSQELTYTAGQMERLRTLLSDVVRGACGADGGGLPLVHRRVTEVRGPAAGALR